MSATYENFVEKLLGNAGNATQTRSNTLKGDIRDVALTTPQLLAHSFIGIDKEYSDRIVGKLFPKIEKFVKPYPIHPNSRCSKCIDSTLNEESLVLCEIQNSFIFQEVEKIIKRAFDGDENKHILIHVPEITTARCNCSRSPITIEKILEAEKLEKLESETESEYYKRCNLENMRRIAKAKLNLFSNIKETFVDYAFQLPTKQSLIQNVLSQVSSNTRSILYVTGNIAGLNLQFAGTLIVVGPLDDDILTQVYGRINRFGPGIKKKFFYFEPDYKRSVNMEMYNRKCLIYSGDEWWKQI